MAQTVLSKGALGEPLTIHIGFTLGVMMAVYMAGGVSGKSRPHLQLTYNNPKDKGFEFSVRETQKVNSLLYLILQL